MGAGVIPALAPSVGDLDLWQVREVMLELRVRDAIARVMQGPGSYEDKLAAADAVREEVRSAGHGL